MKKIIYIADPEILAIPIVECNEPLIDLKTQNQLVYGPPPETELTANCYTKMRKQVFEKLCRAQKDLPNNWRFRIYEGFRSLEVQNMLFEQEYKKLTVQYPKKNHAELFHETTRLVSPVINLDGTRNIPPHNTGAAIDIEIITAESELIDMGMTAKDWISVEPDLCLTHCPTLTKQARQNRKILLDTLTIHGFINYPTEWWHFSYGDRYWAYHTKQNHAFYGSVEDQLY